MTAVFELSKTTHNLDHVATMTDLEWGGGIKNSGNIEEQSTQTYELTLHSCHLCKQLEKHLGTLTYKGMV